MAGGVEHLLAAEVVDDGHGDLVQDVGDAAACTGGVNIVSCEWMNTGWTKISVLRSKNPC